MCNWRRWVLPGILATAVLTALAMFFHSATIEDDLTAKAGSALQAENPWASVELDGRDLTLTGVAPSEEAAEAALAIAENAYDVRIADNATTLPPIASPYPFNAIKGDDGITLTGNYPNEAIRAEIVAAAETANPGISVTDELTLARGAPEGFAALAGLGLSQLGGLVNGEASLSDTNYSVKGLAADPAAYEAELNRANGDLPSNGVLASADITAPSVSPYTWSATKSDDNTITLTGFAPDIAARAAVGDAAAERNPDSTIVNELQIATGAPDAYSDMTSFGLGQLSDLSSGSATLADTSYAITGIAASSDAYDAARSAANGELPGGELANAAITPPAAEGSYNWGATKGPDGSITLTGLMPTPEARERIATRAAEVNPGATINNQIRIASGPPEGFVDAAEFSLGYLPRFTAGAVNMSDSDLNVQGRAADAGNFELANALNADLPAGINLSEEISLPPAAGAYEVLATKSESVITLQGYVPSTAAKAQIAAAAAEFGVPVVDRLEVASGAPEGVDWGAAGVIAVNSLKDASSGSARLADGTIAVDADLAPNTVSVEDAQAAFSDSLVDDVQAGTVDYRLPRISPYTWSATNGEAITIDGYVPSRMIGEKAISEAGRFFPNADIVDEQQLASGEPRGLGSAISVGLASLSRLENASAEISGNILTVKGTALTLPAKLDIERKVANGVPPGFTGLADIQVRPAPLEAGGLGGLTSELCQLQLNNALEGGINFDTNKADISETSLGVLDQLAYTAQQCPDANIEIGGHTDSDGSADYNQDLSQRRASAVANYLIVSGVSSGRLSVVGYGETVPIASNDTEEGKAQNRRIEFTISQ